LRKRKRKRKRKIERFSIKDLAVGQATKVQGKPAEGLQPGSA
jgi:hypothetical protein